MMRRHLLRVGALVVAIAIVVAAAACNRIVNLTPPDAFELATDAADIPADAALADAPDVDAAVDAAPDAF